MTLLYALGLVIFFGVGYYLGRDDSKLEAETADQNRRFDAAIKKIDSGEMRPTELLRDCVLADRKKARRRNGR